MSEEMAEQVEAPQAPVQNEGPWYSGLELDESTTGYVQTKGWQSPKDLLDSYRNLEKFKGTDEKHILKLPEEQLPENMGEVWNKLGRPETPDGYKVELPEGIKLDENRFDAMRKLAHENGITGDAFAKIAKMDAEYQLQQQKAYEESVAVELQKQQVELKNEWGSRYDESVFIAQKGMREMGIDGETAEILQVGLGYDGMMKFFHKVASAMGEKAFAEGEKRSDFGITKQQARYEMDAILAEAKTDPSVAAQFKTNTGPKYARYNQLLAIRHES